MTKSEARLRAEVEAQKRRLDYVVLQLSREAKFMPKWKLETARFHRAYDATVEVRDALEAALRESYIDEE